MTMADDPPLLESTPLYRRPWVICLALGIVAFLFRLPKLFQIPGFTESNELRITLDVYRGNVYPLNDFRPYLGALTNYFMGGLFWVLGLHYWVPRTILVLASSATISLVYLLGRRLVGNAAGFLGALLLAGSLYHILFLSHVPWPNSYTPFFIVLMMLLFFIGLQNKKPYLLIFAGFLFGLAMQTHPSVITLAPSVLAVFLIQPKEDLRFFLRHRMTYMAFPAAALGYLNMIYFDIHQALAHIQTSAYVPKYAPGRHSEAHGYLYNLENAWVLLIRLVSGSYQEFRSLSAYFHDPFFVICSVCLIAGIIFCVMKRKWEIPLLLFFPMFLIPIFNPNYDFYFYGRYFGFLMPLSCLLLAFTVSELVRIARSHKWKISELMLWILLPAPLFALHICNLNNVYGYYERYTDDNMKMYREARSVLIGKYERKNTIVLIDQIMFKATPMEIYLETDGWQVLHLAALFQGKDKNKYVNLGDMSRQIRYFESQSPRKIVAIISGFAVKPLLDSRAYASFERSVAGGPGVPSVFIFCLAPRNAEPDPSKIADPLVMKLYQSQAIPLGHRHRHHVIR
jgi:4-amino-4-deoxy-L-arabinose transferase-like glycosyltransferase